MDELEISGKRYISSRLAAKEHKYHADYIGQLVRGGKVAGQKVGRAWYIDAQSLAEYLGKEVPPRGPKTQSVTAGSEDKPLTSVFGSATGLSSAPSRDLELGEESSERSVAEEEPEIQKEPEPEFALPFRKSGRQHVIAAIETTEPAKEYVAPDVPEEKEVEEEPTVESVQEIVFETPAEEPSEENFIPVKISVSPIETTQEAEAEDSFYKVSRKGLRYIAQDVPAQGRKKVIEPVQKNAPKVKQRYAFAVSAVMLAGILSLGVGALAAYYLHSLTTINEAGQTSGVILSQ